MGNIKQDIKDYHLTSFPNELDIIKPFIDGFFINWAKRHKYMNTEISIYLLNPETFMKESYGFDKQILLAYSPYNIMDTRTLHAVEDYFKNPELLEKGVESYCYFLISDASDIESWLLQNGEIVSNRTIVPFYSFECIQNKNVSFFVRNVLNRKYFGRDIFDYRLPLLDDSYFFGRKVVINSIIDSVKNGKNKGIFGLRKTGKTSLLYKIKRMIEFEQKGLTLIYDCKTPDIRKLHWFELYSKIISDIAKHYRLKNNYKISEKNALETLKNILESIPLDQKIILVFDEIEWISFLAKLDLHWKEEFLEFWQTFWSAQTSFRNLTSIIAGVNPTVSEKDIVNEVQNPLFGIVSNVDLAGLSIDDIKEMLKSIGKRMGLNFEPDAIQYIFDRYGGHPLLTRRACSLINSSIQMENQNRPFLIKKEKLIKDEDWRDSEVSFYCKHIVSELSEFYPDEYNMLEDLASGQKLEFIEFSQYPEFVKHLISYGLLIYDQYKMPKISIQAVERFVGLELARKEKRKTIYKIIEPNKRIAWLKKRILAIQTDINFLERLIIQKNQLSLYGINSYPEGNKLNEIEISHNEKTFNSFINILYRCFVESTENFGKSIGNNNYYWTEIKNSYPSLFYSFQRIKLYRNNADHLKLNATATDGVIEYLRIDLEGKNPSLVDELYFVLQQCTLDSLLASIQVEINNLS
jgi:hypothetical protein